MAVGDICFLSTILSDPTLNLFPGADTVDRNMTLTVFRNILVPHRVQAIK
jgi:hypothetical protein